MILRVNNLYMHMHLNLKVYVGRNELNEWIIHKFNHFIADYLLLQDMCTFFR